MRKLFRERCYEHEHRFAEQEHETATEPEPSDQSRDPVWQNGCVDSSRPGQRRRSGMETIVLVLSRLRRCSCS
jgi:hypothetical protein